MAERTTIKEEKKYHETKEAPKEKGCGKREWERLNNSKTERIKTVKSY